MNLNVVRTEKGTCDECGQELRGVRFYLGFDRKGDSFLCWEHFRLNTEVLLEAGVVRRRPRLLDRGVTESETHSTRSWSHTHGSGTTEGISRGESISHSEGESRTETFGEV